MKTAERIEARRLRREEGRSVREIANLLRVSRGTASVWVRDVSLTDEQLEALRLRNPRYNGQVNGSAQRSEHFRQLRREYQKQGRELARRAGPLHVAGCMLYWAEGDKHRNAAAISYSDPEVLRLFLRFLRTISMCGGPAFASISGQPRPDGIAAVVG